VLNIYRLLVCSIGGLFWQELMNEGKIDEANELMAEYRSSVVKGRGNKGPRRMGKEEGSHHDSLMDEWDVA